eukprot:scaffold8203_cov54-Phaeocystis_antarctica.AAC.1
MLKYLDGISDEEITALEIPTGTPLVRGRVRVRGSSRSPQVDRPPLSLGLYLPRLPMALVLLLLLLTLTTHTYLSQAPRSSTSWTSTCYTYYGCTYYGCTYYGRHPARLRARHQPEAHPQPRRGLPSDGQVPHGRRGSAQGAGGGGQPVQAALQPGGGGGVEA